MAVNTNINVHSDKNGQSSVYMNKHDVDGIFKPVVSCWDGLLFYFYFLCHRNRGYFWSSYAQLVFLLVFGNKGNTNELRVNVAKIY